MKMPIRFLALMTFLGQTSLNLPTAGHAEEGPGGSERIVTLGGTITEIVFALGAGERVVGVDASSSFPAAAERLPKVAYHRRLSAEGVLSLSPTLIIATTEAGPPEALRQIESAGVRLLILPHEATVDGAVDMIEGIARDLGARDTGAALVRNLKEDLARVESSIPRTGIKSKSPLSLRPRPGHPDGGRPRHGSRHHDRPGRRRQCRPGLQRLQNRSHRKRRWPPRPTSSCSWTAAWRASAAFRGCGGCPDWP